MSLLVTVCYEPDGSPSLRDRKLSMKLSRLQTGQDICREVYDQIKGELQNPIGNYSLFSPHQKLWLSLEKQVGLLSLESGARLEFRSKMRSLRVRFLDASSKLVKVNETKPVKELVRNLCSQLRLHHPEEMSLVVAGDYAVTKHHPAKTMVKRSESSSSPSLTRRGMNTGKTAKSAGIGKEPASKDSPPISPGHRRRTHRPGSAGSRSRWGVSKVKKQISKKHQIRLDTPWLDPNKTLAEQEVTESDELILMYRFYYNMELDRGANNVEMLYKQARATYLAGELLCSVNDMVRLSAILCQITRGDYSAQKHSPEFLVQIRNLIAPPKCKIKAIAKQIMAEHASLKGLSAADGKCWFVKLWSSLELFGIEFLSCTNTDTKDKGLIGISKDRILFLFHKKKKSNVCWDIDTLVQWKHDLPKDTVSLMFSHDGSTQVLNLHLPDYSGVLVDCLEGHRELSDSVPVSRTIQEYQFDEELEAAISDFAAQTRKDAKDRRTLTNLTYEDVYWASKIENPLLSDEELAALRNDSWENPVFENMDQLMDERFSFLDFTEYNPETLSTTSGYSSASKGSDSPPSRSPHWSSRRPSNLGNQSPLVTTAHVHSVENSPTQPHKPRQQRGSPPQHLRLTNGLLDSYFKGHSRSGSSCSSNDGGNSPRITSKEETFSLPSTTEKQTAIHMQADPHAS